MIAQSSRIYHFNNPVKWFHWFLFITLLTSLIIYSLVPAISRLDGVSSQFEELLSGPAETSRGEESTLTGLTADEWRSISGVIQQAEYQFSWHAPTSEQAKSFYWAPNRSNGWVSYFDAQRLEISSSGQQESDSWRWGLNLTGDGYAGSAQLLSDTPAMSQDKNRLVFQWNADLTEWYLNDPNGLEQGFTIQNPPLTEPTKQEKTGPLFIEMSLMGDLKPVLTEQGQAVRFMDPEGETILRYKKLLVTDKNGQEVPAKLDIHQTGVASSPVLRIVVDDSEARYPLVIDPLVFSERKILTASDGAADDQFGQSVSIDGDTMVVGAFLDDDMGTDSGSAYVLYRNQGGTNNWGEVKKLTPGDGAAADLFGWSASISGDTIVIGSWLDDDKGGGSGSAYVFERDQGGPDNWGQVKKLTASDGTGDDNFGWTVSISGDTIVVGARNGPNLGSNTGSAYVFERNQGGANNWGEVKKLVANDAASGDNFGWSVSISGDTIVVGAHYDDDSGTNSGSAYVFERNQGGTNNWGEVKKLIASDAAGGDEFGWSVSIAGDTIVVGASNDDIGSNSNQGSAYVFDRDQGGADNWGQVKKLTASDGANEEWFGFSTSIFGNTLVVGAAYDDDSGLQSGSAYVFDRDLGGQDNWGEVAKVTASDGAADDQFGNHVAIFGDTIVIGARHNDIGDNSNQGSVYIFGNNPPVATDDAYATNEDILLSIAAPGVLDDDEDADGDPMTAVLVSAVSDGSLSLNPDGSFSYTPNADFNGTDSFTYVANDGLADSNVATVTITVNPVNDPPVTVDDGYATDEDTLLSIALPGVLGNDIDADGDPLTALLVSDVSNGSLILNDDGSSSYTPNADFNGIDSFTYVANDGLADSNVATVTLTVNPVNDPPVAQDDSISGNENTAINRDVLVDNGNGPDSDVDGNLDANSVSQVSGPSNGSLTLNSDGTFSYDPNPNFNGSDSFVYQVCDTALACDTATVSITVNPVNDAPVAVDDSFSGNEDAITTGNVLINDTDLDWDPLTAVLISDVSNGSLTLNPDGSFSYTPNADFNGTDSFTYVANDGLADSNTTTVTLTVNPVNDPPLAQDDSFSGNENTTISGDVLADNGNGSDSDVDGNLDTNSVSLVSGSSNGSLALSNGGTFSYDPNPNFTGNDSFVYQVCDTALACDTATVIITVLHRQRQVYIPIVLSGSGL